MKKRIFLLLLMATAAHGSASRSPSTYSTQNNAYLSFDVSMPIDSTGYTLKGNHLTGGMIQFNDHGASINALLADEQGSFQAPLVTDQNNQLLIKTNVRYRAIKFINHNGINNLFIKIGMGRRTQKVAGLDASVLKPGTYTWQAPIFAFGREHTTVENKNTNIQFMEVGSLHGGPASKNVMYTQDFYLYSKGKGNIPITAQPIKSRKTNEILSQPYSRHFTCWADGLWGAGGADPYRTLTGNCQGFSTTFPAGPNLDDEYGSFILPTVHTPWTGASADRCVLPGSHKIHNGCVNAKIELNFHYMAQKIRVPLTHEVSLFAEFGTVYRTIRPGHLRYQCKGNVYLKEILNPAYCLKKNYLPGGASYPYFAVGYEIKTKDGKRYSARYINIPGQENGNRLVWLDASNTYVYAISNARGASKTQVKKYLNQALNTLQQYPRIYQVLGQPFFAKILKKNTQLHPNR